MNNVDALKDLYIALGGSADDVAECVTSVDVLNVISAKYDGQSNAILNPIAIENIAAVAENIGGGGTSDFSVAEVTFTSNDPTTNAEVHCAYTISGASLGFFVKQLNEPVTLSVILYKGKAYASLESGTFENATGGIEITDINAISITGNGSVAINPGIS